MTVSLMEKIFFLSYWVKKNNRLQRQNITITAFLSHENLIGLTEHWLNILRKVFLQTIRILAQNNLTGKVHLWSEKFHQNNNIPILWFQNWNACSLFGDLGFDQRTNCSWNYHVLVLPQFPLKLNNLGDSRKLAHLILQLSAQMCAVRCVEPALNLSVQKHTNPRLDLCVYTPVISLAHSREMLSYAQISKQENPFAFFLAST